MCTRLHVLYNDGRRNPSMVLRPYYGQNHFDSLVRFLWVVYVCLVRCEIKTLYEVSNSEVAKPLSRKKKFSFQCLYHIRWLCTRYPPTRPSFLERTGGTQASGCEDRYQIVCWWSDVLASKMFVEFKKRPVFWVIIRYKDLVSVISVCFEGYVFARYVLSVFAVFMW